MDGVEIPLLLQARRLKVVMMRTVFRVVQGVVQSPSGSNESTRLCCAVPHLHLAPDIELTLTNRIFWLED